MSPALLEGGSRLRGGGLTEPRLFEDLRRARPDARPRPAEPGPGEPGPATARGERHPRSGGDGLTLEAHLERIWEGLLAAGDAECPVCRALMHGLEEGGACAACGSRLS